MKIVILAGGKGSRISRITKKIPKPMIKINNLTILEHILNIYSSQGYKDFIIPVGYKGSLIKKHFKKLRYKKDIYKIKNLNYVKILFVQTGLNTMTGGRLKLIKKLITSENKNFMVTYGDGLANINLKKLEKFHLKKNKIATLTAVRPLSRYGVLDIQGSKVKVFEEKKPLKTGWINGGFFIFNKKIFNYLKAKSTVLEKEPLENLAKKNQLTAYKHFSFWHSIDTIRDKEYLESILKNTKKTPWIHND
tara:strand:+ start:1034 stop:1780 length:747 start_codon:yes stop_codon:yes gene_type:complete